MWKFIVWVIVLLVVGYLGWLGIARTSLYFEDWEQERQEALVASKEALLEKEISLAKKRKAFEDSQKGVKETQPSPPKTSDSPKQSGVMQPLFGNLFSTTPPKSPADQVKEKAKENLEMCLQNLQTQKLCLEAELERLETVFRHQGQRNDELRTDLNAHIENWKVKRTQEKEWRGENGYAHTIAYRTQQINELKKQEAQLSKAKVSRLNNLKRCLERVDLEIKIAQKNLDFLNK